MIVIDVGCARYGGDYSIERLIQEFHPRILIGLDPHPSVENGVRRVASEDGQMYSFVATFNMAAWTRDGQVRFNEGGLGSHVADVPSGHQVVAVDLARLILELPDGEDVVLKMDAEGAEYDLLRHLHATGADERLKLAWVEWHNPDRGRRRIEQSLRCEVVEWRW